jgi:hypothetical protein
MNQQERCDLRVRNAGEARATGELTAEQEWCRVRGFSRREWQRLVFVRWLYRQGRLTEYPAVLATGQHSWEGSGNGR